MHMLSLIQKHAHMLGQRSNHHLLKFQPNPSWAKKRPNRYTSFVDNKKKIQMFLFVKYVFYFTREVDNNYISFVALPLMKYKYCPLHL